MTTTGVPVYLRLLVPQRRELAAPRPERPTQCPILMFPRESRAVPLREENGFEGPRRHSGAEAFSRREKGKEQ